MNNTPEMTEFEEVWSDAAPELPNRKQRVEYFISKNFIPKSVLRNWITEHRKKYDPEDKILSDPFHVEGYNLAIADFLSELLDQS